MASGPAPPPALDSGDRRILIELLRMTGREDRLARTPPVDQEQITIFEAVWPLLKEAGTASQARCDLLNRLLLSLGIKPVSHDFFCTVFGDIDFHDIAAIQRSIDKFRMLCMLEYGNFRFGYKHFRLAPRIAEAWSKYFPDQATIDERAQVLRKRPKPAGLSEIAGGELFALGYLAGEHSQQINEARRILGGVLDRAIEDNASDFGALRRVARDNKVDNVPALLAKASIPAVEALVYKDLPLFDSVRGYPELLNEMRRACIAVDQAAITRAQNAGIQNARTYMSMHDLDVYVATSMRDPLHFTTNWAFVRALFRETDIREWNLHYFDPTQAFLADRIQKGLLECLMIKRARVTVYNAQEGDTFGKDAEAGVTLAQGKPVIVYVSRLFEKEDSFRIVYDAIDAAARVERDPFLGMLLERGLLSEDEREGLLAPEKTKADVVRALIERHAVGALRDIDDERIAMELIAKGYDTARLSKPVRDFAVDRIVLLERRALTFRDIHPLSLQTAPHDGVARGLIVTRTVTETAKVLRGIFIGTLRFEIVEDKENWLLVDEITRSPVRVVTKDPVLTTAFWSESWGNQV